jgi:hypothetical protein
MDDDFAFDIYHHTREEWEEERREMEEHNRRFNAEWAERERLGVTNSRSQEDGAPTIWSRSFNVEDTVNVPLGVRVFGVGCHLAELIVGLRAGADRKSIPPEMQSYIDQVNRDFGNLREVLQSSDTSLALALIDPVLDHFTETLATVASDRPDLAPQCEALSDEIHGLLEPPPSKPKWDDGDPELPF